MATFKPSKDFEKKLRKAAEPQLKKIEKGLNRELQRKVDSIARTHRGWSEREIQWALERAMRSTGVQKPNKAEVQRIAKDIAGS